MVLGGGIPSGNLKSLKVVELQKKLRDLGLPASGKKDDLIQVAHFVEYVPSLHPNITPDF